MLVTNKHASSLALTSAPTAVRLSLFLFSVSISFYVLLGLLILSRIDFSHSHLVFLLATLRAYIDGRAPLYPFVQLSAHRLEHAAPKVTLNLLIFVLVNGQVTRTRLVLIYLHVIAESCTVHTVKSSAFPIIYLATCRGFMHSDLGVIMSLVNVGPYFDRRRALEPLVRFQNAQGCAKRRDRSWTPAELCTARTLVKILSGSPNFSEHSKGAHAK